MTMTICSLAVIALLTTGAAPVAQQDKSTGREEFSAILSNISNVGGAGITPLTIRISRWTSDSDNERLLEVLRDKGQTAFLDALLDGKAVGSISTPTSLKYDFFYARQSVTPEGDRRIMLISDRPMTVSERVSSAQSRDYPFTVIDLQVPREGKGEGTLAQMVQLRLLGNIFGIENLATGPMRLSDVKKVK
jgi:hypothetical protein